MSVGPGKRAEVAEGIGKDMGERLENKVNTLNAKEKRKKYVQLGVGGGGVMGRGSNAKGRSQATRWRRRTLRRSF